MDEEDESCSFSCEGEPGVLEPDADIAGLGVILGFLITAYLTVALLVAYYVWYFDPNLDPFRASGDDAATTEVPNPVDRVVLLSLRKRNPSDRKNAGAGMEGILNKCIIMFADIQIVTGIAILIGGYSTLPCGISAYHWQLVVDLAWFSSVTHLAALTFLRRYLHNRPVEKWCRVAFMLVMLALLCVAVGPTAKFAWLIGPDMEGGELRAHPASHAICFYRPDIAMDWEGGQSLAITILLLVYGYAIRIAKLSSRFSKSLRRSGLKYKRKSMERLERWNPDAFASGWQLFKSVCLDPVLVAFFQVLHVQLDLFSSVLAEVYWLIVSVTWGTKRLVATRGFSPGGENSWSFGQVLPLILLAAPLVSFLKSLPGQERSQVSGEGGHNSQRLSTGSINDVDNTQTGPQQDVERPAAVAPSPSDYEDILDDYEKSSSFRGALFLAAWFYISLTVYIMTDAPRDIVALFYTLNFEVYVFQPVIQLTWPLWCLWIDKIGSRQRPWETRSLRLLLFLALLETSIYEFFNSSAVEATFLEPGVIAASLLAIYAIFLTWALIRLRARQLEATIGGGTLYHLRSAVLQLVMTCLVMAASLFMIWCYELLEFPGEAWAFLGFIIFVFGACIGVEAYFERHAVKEWWQTIWRGSFFVVAWASFLLLMYVAPFPHSSTLAAFFSTVVGFGTLSLFYASRNFMRGWFSITRRRRFSEVELGDMRLGY